MLVADSLRLGGAILGQYPDMLAPQLVGRLLSEVDNNRDRLHKTSFRPKTFRISFHPQILKKSSKKQ
jgi:hypothetical protein